MGGTSAPQKEDQIGFQWLAMKIPDFTKFGKDFEGITEDTKLT